MRSLRRWLKRLEPVRWEEAALWLLCVDERGLVLNDGSDPLRPFVDKHYNTLPGNPRVLVGVDPLEVRGRRVRTDDDDAGRERGQTG